MGKWPAFSSVTYREPGTALCISNSYSGGCPGSSTPLMSTSRCWSAVSQTGIAHVSRPPEKLAVQTSVGSAVERTFGTEPLSRLS